MCTALCTTAAHNAAQNRPDNFPSYPPDNHCCSNDVYFGEGGRLSWKRGVLIKRVFYFSRKEDDTACNRKTDITKYTSPFVHLQPFVYLHSLHHWHELLVNRRTEVYWYDQSKVGQKQLRREKPPSCSGLSVVRAPSHALFAPRRQTNATRPVLQPASAVSSAQRLLIHSCNYTREKKLLTLYLML